MKLTTFSALCILTTTAWAYHWPSPKFDAIEGLLYEFEPEPPNTGSLHLTLNGCLPQDNASTAAEWLRFVRRLLFFITWFCNVILTYAYLKAYHDMATHNIDDGTGGLDASLYYELDRDEVRSQVF